MNEQGRFAFIPTDLTIVFVALRACGVITWGYGWVLLPLALSYVLGIVIASLK